MAIETSQITTDAAVERPTAADTAAPPMPPLATTQHLIPQVSMLRYRANDVHADVSILGRSIYDLNLRERTAEKEKNSVTTLLTSVTQAGVGWAALSRLLKVSVPAIRKWRQGQGASPENRKTLAELSALMQMLDEQFMVEDPASWLEIPLASTQTSLVDLYAAGRTDLILDYAGSWIRSADQVMDAFDPAWRARASTQEFETYIAADGQPAVRRRAGKSVVARPARIAE